METFLKAILNMVVFCFPFLFNLHHFNLQADKIMMYFVKHGCSKRNLTVLVDGGL